ncbi:MAG TPA: type II methionyl aminopeptidase [Candidatus Acidoferrum sp.]|nr:type II methionyl aminopeptidase [Candidatus Acidoferrum sp.]
MEDKKPDLKIVEEVGAISYQALKVARDMVKPGVKLLDVAKKAESFLKEKGYGLAFPLNLSINEQAAHYTPSLEDETVFKENDIVKVDFGAEKDGVLGDCALTVDLSGKNQKLVEASMEALQNAISVVKAGVEVRKIGAEIEKAITAKGFEPIRNLGGHSVKVHDLHSDIFIPNYDNEDDTKLEEGMVVAIEPFATNGEGMVTESDTCEIYGFNAEMGVRLKEARQIMEEIKKNYSHEPFAVRWFSNIVPSSFGLYAGIAELSRNEALVRYPTLVEVGKGMVSQAELEVLVEKEGCKILTK